MVWKYWVINLSALFSSLKQWRQNMCVVDMKLRPNTFMCVGVIIITTQRFLYIQRIYAILKCVNHKLTSTTHLCKQNMSVGDNPSMLYNIILTSIKIN